MEFCERNSEDLVFSYGNHFPRIILKHVDRIPRELWLESSEQEETPSVTEYSLRRSLWSEYHYAKSRNTVLDCKRVYKGICSPAHFYALLAKPMKLRWILSPSMRTEVQKTNLKDPLLDQISKILRTRGNETQIQLGHLMCSVKEIAGVIRREIYGTRPPVWWSGLKTA